MYDFRFNIPEEHLAKSVYTTDRGSNIILALADETKLDCAAHVINIVLRNGFDTKNECPAKVYRLIVM